MKKLLTIIILIISFNFSFGECKIDSQNIDVSSALDSCAPEKLVKSSGDYTIESGLKVKIAEITKNIMTLFGVISILSIVYGGFNLTISLGDDEKVKKSKDIIKWSLIGFIIILSSYGIISLVINLVYGLGE